MNNEPMEPTDDDLTRKHLLYLGRLLIEAIKEFHTDTLGNFKFAPELTNRPTYLRVMELRDKYEQAALLKGCDFY